MQITVTYIHHNCFVLETPSRTFLFDYPGDMHLPEGAEAVVQNRVAGRNLAVFISHSHDDHLNEDLKTMASTASSVHYIISDDVLEMRPEVIPADCETLIVEPDESYTSAGLSIETLMSNDLGVAFLVQDGDFRFYYGGDLAKWIWKSASAREESFTAHFFKQAMIRVHEFKPHVVFSNVDKRLENLAGGAEAYRETGARVFIPMHTFGETEWLGAFRDSVGDKATELFVYADLGDSMGYEI
ncbi:MBL fold metallo-hydrolase [Pseudodesulfovibrio piezophilus]|uniref:Metallo-beta-lactamase domain-containing protein n=1 Tax=Pseudodesulfovibrio piezophilus (strain DSM 21447 / JCM 15486 / C1TLV30) TaxID=1322246 RepID=M1WJR1_PSEP2|nr:MBL fold metallo-hydrolase [Pseudodesulfovibrio piezophilus]CCH48336.1 conserved protein of unknown function [Pseudodesulfovibrio piezophilus C1TLV30]